MNISPTDIIEKIKYLLEMLRVKFNYTCDGVSYNELCSYLTGETPTSDIIDFESVIGNEYYFIHEIIEICELKKRGIAINEETVTKYYPEVYEAHIEALDKELNYALIKNDLEWIKDRVTTAYKQLGIDKEILLKYIDRERIDILMEKMHSVLAKYNSST